MLPQSIAFHKFRKLSSTFVADSFSRRQNRQIASSWIIRAIENSFTSQVDVRLNLREKILNGANTG